MRYKRLKRCSPRTPQIKYIENTDQIIDNITSVDLPEKPEETTYNTEASTSAESGTNPLYCGVVRPGTGCGSSPYVPFKVKIDGYCPACGSNKVVFDTWKIPNPCNYDGGFTCLVCDSDFDADGWEGSGRCLYKLNILSKVADTLPIRPCDGGLPCGTSKATVASTLAGYLSGDTSTSTTTTTTGVSEEASSQMLRYRYIQDYLKSTGIGYKYYTGHQRSWDLVIRYKGGNCCDLARLITKIGGDSRLDGDSVGSELGWRYVKGQIKVNGNLYNHVWVEFYVDGEWKIFDPVSYLNGGSASQVYGTLKQTYTYVMSGDPC